MATIFLVIIISIFIIITVIIIMDCLAGESLLQRLLVPRSGQLQCSTGLS
jgi:hypothetical protein